MNENREIARSGFNGFARPGEVVVPMLRLQAVLGALERKQLPALDDVRAVAGASWYGIKHTEIERRIKNLISEPQSTARLPYLAGRLATLAMKTIKQDTRNEGASDH